MSSAEMPIGLALVLCDTIIEDKTSGKKSLIGLFGQIQTPKIPCVHQSMMLLVSLTGGKGNYPCKIVCEHPDLPAPVFSISCTVKMDNPFQVLDLIFKIKSIRFPLASQYWIRVFIDEVPLMMRPISIIKTGKQTEIDDDSDSNES